MRTLLMVLAAASMLRAQAPQTQISHTTENLRGVSVVTRQIAWATGTHGTYLRTLDAGRTWVSAQVPEASALDFRGVVAFSADEAFLMSAGPGDQSRIYHTSDGGQHWQLQFTSSNPKAFFDSMAFWDRSHGMVLGDPVADDKGQSKFQLLLTSDGQSWIPIPPSQLPPAAEGEAAFAASNSCLAIIRSSAGLRTSEKEGASASDPNIWFGTGGRVARVFHSPDLGRNWEVFDAPITHGTDSAGIFSIALRDPLHGVIVGGDYKHPDQDGPDLAFTNDGGKTWKASSIYPQAYFSAVGYDRRSGINPAAAKDPHKDLNENQADIRLFIVGPKFIFDFRPPLDPRRISPPKKSGIQFSAVSPYPDGGALFVGPAGSIATVP